MRCLYCGKQMALFKKLTGGGEFCSDAHKQSYHEEYNKLALSRLMEAQTRHEEAPARQPNAAAGSSGSPEKPVEEPTARGEYFKQAVAIRNQAIAMLAPPSLEPAGWPIGFPVPAALHFAPEPIRAGVIMEHRARAGETTAPVSLVLAPAVSSISLPEIGDLSFALEPRESGLVMDHHARDGATVAPVALALAPAVSSISLPENGELHLAPAPGESGLVMEHRARDGATTVPVSLVLAAAVSSTGLPSSGELHFAPAPRESGLVMEHRARYGATATPTAAVLTPAVFPVGLPEIGELHFVPALGESGVIVQSRAVPGGSTAVPTASDYPQLGIDPGCAYPEHHFEIVNTVAPPVSGPVVIELSPAPTPEAEFRLESASRFQFFWEFPESLQPDWVDGLELASAEERLAAVLRASLPAAPVPAETPTEAPEQAVHEVEAGPASPAEPAEAAEPAPQPEQAKAPASPFRVASVRSSASREPVINEALLSSLFGGKKEATPRSPATPAAVAPKAPVAAPAPAAPQKPAAAKTATPASAKAEASGADKVKGPFAALLKTPATAKADAPAVPVKAPATAKQEKAQQLPTEAAVPKVEAASGADHPREPGFLPVNIRPAGAPGKSRLMQSFQAIALVSANPQIPSWNTLPFRPKMALGRPPGAGAGAMERSKQESSAPAEARKPSSTTVEVADGPAPAADDSVPTFGAAAKPRSGLSRWFKLGMVVAVLGIAGSTAAVEGRGARASAVGAYASMTTEPMTTESMTTEFAVCRN
jgi:hypothetical protein